MKRRLLSGLPHRTIGVAEFKARCLELIEAVGTRGDELTITKRGQPIARVIPISRAHEPLRGMLRAYDKQTGKEAAAVYIPAPQTGSPMTYMMNGKQYIVLAISGANYSGELIAFKLP